MMTVPFPIEDLQKIIQNPNETYVVDYKNSKIKGRPFIFYLSNINAKVSIDLTRLDKEELGLLLKDYMEINVLFKCEELNVLVMLVLLYYLKVEHREIATFDIPDDFFEYFVKENEELLMRYFVFLSSMISYCQFVQDKAEGVPHDLGPYEGVIDDAKFIGVNVVWLFEIPSFYELFFSADIEDYPQYFFPAQFDDFIFNGKKLFAFFMPNNEPNWLILQQFLAKKQYGYNSNRLPERNQDPVESGEPKAGE